ncbi:MAG: carboxylesterase [Gammaproteobacteria bacterium]|nr:carboxylesterase [Gammaproteobacteria bacterium]
MHSIDDYVEVNTNQSPDSSVIWLHGLGADGHDFEGIVPELELPQNLGVRFIFPHAPIQPVSVNGGYPMRAWFDIFGLHETARQDEPGIRKSLELVGDLIDSIIEKGVPSERIIVGGFSQGGAIALHLGLRYPKKLAGVIGLSTYLPLTDQMMGERQTINAATPIFLAHGKQDTLVPYTIGQSAYDKLASLGYSVSWHDYEIAHTVNKEEAQDLGKWIQKVLL